MKGWAQDDVAGERFDVVAVSGAARRVRRRVHRAPTAKPGGTGRLGNEGMKRHV